MPLVPLREAAGRQPSSAGREVFGAKLRTARWETFASSRLKLNPCLHPCAVIIRYFRIVIRNSASPTLYGGGASYYE